MGNVQSKRALRIGKRQDIYLEMSNLTDEGRVGKIWAIMAIILVIITFGGLSGYLYINNLHLKDEIQELDKRKEKEYKAKLVQEREFIKKDLDEKYRADMVSFEALHKRLEIEKKRVRELEEKLKNLITEEPKN